MGILSAGSILLAVGLPGPPRLLINHTPSEPLGFYWRHDGGPVVGDLVAFPAPAAAYPYADRHLAYLHREPMLKAVAAGPGDRVCSEGQRLVINGAVRGRVMDQDGEGRALPQWRGCRALAAGEVFVFSDRVPNSFDSRYFGPVSLQSVLGVYRYWKAL